MRPFSYFLLKHKFFAFFFCALWFCFLLAAAAVIQRSRDGWQIFNALKRTLIWPFPIRLAPERPQRYELAQYRSRKQPFSRKLHKHSTSKPSKLLFHLLIFCLCSLLISTTTTLTRCKTRHNRRHLFHAHAPYVRLCLTFLTASDSQRNIKCQNQTRYFMLQH